MSNLFYDLVKPRRADCTDPRQRSPGGELAVGLPHDLRPVISVIVIALLGLAVMFAVMADVQPALAAPLAQESTSSATVTPTLGIPFLNDWAGSAHADFTAEAFNHWNEEDPAQVPETCAKCHSSIGHLDFLGVDGSAAGVVDQPAPIGTVIECVACHNSVNITKTSVVMPSGLEITGLGDESRCMECHQGRESTVSVNATIAKAEVADEDTISDQLGFRNIHYYAAAATKYGTLAKGGYEYEGQAYDANFAHVDEFNTCIECHNSHTLKVRVDKCAGCHEDVKTVEDLKNVRMAGSAVDYDGDGNTEEGIYYELEGVRDLLYQAIQAYASEITQTPIAYSPNTHPYFFIDTNENGVVDPEEEVGDNRYASWTARLVKAAYNYQTSVKDPGAFAHGGKYIIELLYDSTSDLNTALAEPVDLSAAHRIDAGHFAGSQEPFRHWDAEGVVPGTCAKCHTPGGLPMLLKEGVTISQPPSNGLQCTTCHNDLQEFTRYEVKEVKFPSGAVVTPPDQNSGLCLNCHQGRESTVSVNKLIGDTEADTVSDSLRFLNVHYFAAGATRFGTEAKGAYEYADKEYAGFFDHSNVSSCTDCHGAHSLEVDWESCIECHEEVETKEDIFAIRYYFDDWDGDGNTDEGVAGEIDTMLETLYSAMSQYADETIGTKLAYTPNSYPYFFIDTNGNGTVDADEANNDNRFNSWSPRLLRAAYNYQYVQKDPGAFAHNAPYILQVLYDSIEDVGGDVSSMTRP
ncbi:MAG: hypothetical protein R3C14_50365 [Caldilineaceae bacterium]